jgi:aryl-alcohol dehydrogenase-like predicted oxidoreductase
MDFPVRLGETESASLVDRAMEMGVNLLDTADTYDDGQSEEILGKILKGKRDRIILATKFWAVMHKRPNGGGCSRVHIMQAVEDSLRRLGTDYIDLYQLHHPDPNTPVEEVLSTLNALVKQGKVRYIGVSNHARDQRAAQLGAARLDPVPVQHHRPRDRE